MVCLTVNTRRPLVLGAGSENAYQPPHLRSPKFLAKFKPLAAAASASGKEDSWSLGLPAEPKTPTKKLVKVNGLLTWQYIGGGSPITSTRRLGAPAAFIKPMTDKLPNDDEKETPRTRARAKSIDICEQFWQPKAPMSAPVSVTPMADELSKSEVCEQEELWSYINAFWGKKTEEREARRIFW